jgi:hypothetical protein
MQVLLAESEIDVLVAKASAFFAMGVCSANTSSKVPLGILEADLTRDVRGDIAAVLDLDALGLPSA